MARLLQRTVHALPLLGALWLLRWLPSITDTPLQGVLLLPWRLDALTLTWIFVQTLAVALLPPVSWRDTSRALAALVLLLPALVFEHLLGLPVALIGIAVLLWQPRWLAAALFLLGGLIWLYLIGGAGWYTPETTTALISPIFGLLLAAAYVGINGYPVSLAHESVNPVGLALTPIWLLPLLRTLAWGPWPSGWALAVVLLGGATALWAAAAALWATDEQAIARLAQTWLGLALACIGLATPVGIASALFQLLTYALGVGLLFGPAPSRLWAAPLPLSAAFVAFWLVQGATAASGAFLLAAVIWLGALLSGIAIVRLRIADAGLYAPAQPDADRKPIFAWFVVVGSWCLGILAPLPLRYLIMPAVDVLQGGLTPFGLLDIWPWVGIAALDAGQRRVAVLPSIAVAILALVVAALVWLIARLLDQRAALVASEETDRSFWNHVRQRVWWARGARRRG